MSGYTFRRKRLPVLVITADGNRHSILDEKSTDNEPVLYVASLDTSNVSGPGHITIPNKNIEVTEDAVDSSNTSTDIRETKLAIMDLNENEEIDDILYEHDEDIEYTEVNEKVTEEAESDNEEAESLEIVDRDTEKIELEYTDSTDDEDVDNEGSDIAALDINDALDQEEEFKQREIELLRISRIEKDKNLATHFSNDHKIDHHIKAEKLDNIDYLE